MKSIIQIIALALLFTGCEKVVEIDVNNNIETVVIEGNITNQPGPYFVKITKSVNFYADSEYPAISDALVVISDDSGQIDTLTYTADGVYTTHHLTGEIGRTYTLQVTAEGKNYTAQSTMPAQVNLDSLHLMTIELAGGTRINVQPVFTDPPVLGNNYRFRQYINDVMDNNFFNFNDNINNGLPNQRLLRNPDAELKSGDVIQVEMQCVPLPTYNYFYTLEQQVGNGPGGGTTPANPPNNLSGGALGLFSAHTSQVMTITVP